MKKLSEDLLLPIPHTQWLLNPGGLFQLTE